MFWLKKLKKKIKLSAAIRLAAKQTKMHHPRREWIYPFRNCVSSYDNNPYPI